MLSYNTTEQALEIITEKREFTQEEAYNLSLFLSTRPDLQVKPELTLYLCGYKLSEDFDKKISYAEKAMKKHLKKVKYAKKKGLTIPNEPDIPEYFIEEVVKISGERARSSKDSYFPCIKSYLTFNHIVEYICKNSNTKSTNDLKVSWSNIKDHYKTPSQYISFERVIDEYSIFFSELRRMSLILTGGNLDSSIERDIRVLLDLMDTFGFALEECLSILGPYDDKNIPCHLSFFKQNFVQ